MPVRLTVVILLCLLCPQNVGAQDVGVQQQPQEKSWSAGISLGGGQRSNPLIGGEAIDLWWSVDLAWYGKRWFFDNGDLGFMLRDTANYTINWVARVNTERAFFAELNEGLFSNRIPFSAADPGISDPEPAGSPTGGDELPAQPEVERDSTSTQIPDRDYAVESGIELLRDDSFGSFHGQIMADVSGVHNGYEIWLNYSTDLVLQRWHFIPSVSLNWKSSQLNDYYYGVRPNEAVAELIEYKAGSGLNASLKLSARYYFSERWTLSLVADYERLNNSASDSPLLKDDHITSYFAGIHYAF